MNQQDIHRKKFSIESFLKKMEGEVLSESEFKVFGFELLSGLFRHLRSQKGIHLRWRREEANYLALITIQELKQKKKNDKILNKIYDLLMSRAGQNKTLVDELLDLAETRLDEIHAIQSTNASTPRINLLDQLIQGYVNRNREVTASEVVEKLRAEVGYGTIIDMDDELIIYKHPKYSKRQICANISGIKNRVTAAKKQR